VNSIDKEFHGRDGKARPLSELVAEIPRINEDSRWKNFFGKVA